MLSRERVITAINHKEPDIVPWDLGGMRSTGMMAMAYVKLRKALGLPLEEIKVYDVGQQLAWIDEDVRKILGLDVIALDTEKVLADYIYGWKPYRLPDGTPALIPSNYMIEETEDGGKILYNSKRRAIARMPAGGFYFDGIYHELEDVSTLEEIDKWVPGSFSREELDALKDAAKDLYENTSYAIMGSFGGNIVELGQGLRGWENFMSDLVGNRPLAEKLIEKMVEMHLRNLKLYLEAVGGYIQIIQMGDDLGTQNGPMLSPKLYKELIYPAHKTIYDYIHKNSNIYVFLHSCGGIYELIPYLIDAGVDIINPVQTSARGMDPKRLKSEFGDKLTFWGGGCDTQSILPYGKPEEIAKHIRERVEIFSMGGGFIFTQVHNIQANVPIENIMALVETMVSLTRKK
ncbi:MAG: uroporphyrinogen decarboxylase family protein [bacterium]